MCEGGLKQARRARIGAGLLIGLAITAAGCTEGESGTMLSEPAARSLCDEAIRAAAPDATQVEIPETEVRETVKVYTFRWRFGDGLKMTDPSGTRLDAVVVCRVSKEDRQVVHLDINGETVSTP